MKTKEHIIWNSEIEMENWNNFLKEEYPNINDENEQYQLCQVINEGYKDDEKLNLDVPTNGRIIAIADIGRWNGRRSGCKVLGYNVNEIFCNTECEFEKWFFDGHNVRYAGAHHDGVNYIEFREIREDRNVENLLDAIYEGKEISRKMLNYYTRSLKKYIKKVYGW